MPKDTNKGKRHIGIVVISLLFVLLLCIYPDNNLFTWLAAKREIRQQRHQARRYQLEIVDMKSRIDILTKNRDTLENYARENFHFSEQGESVYLVDDK